MGREFFYCSHCQTRLSGDDFDLGLAVKIGDLVACDRCVGEVIAPLSLKDQEAILLQIRTARAQAGIRPRAPAPSLESPLTPAARRGSTSTRVRTVRPGAAPPASKGVSASKSYTGTIFFVGGMALLGALAALYFLLGSHELTESRAASKEDRTPASPTPAAPAVKFRPAQPPPKPPAAPASPRELAAKAALTKAREAGDRKSVV